MCSLLSKNVNLKFESKSQQNGNSSKSCSSCYQRTYPDLSGLKFESKSQLKKRLPVRVAGCYQRTYPDLSGLKPRFIGGKQTKQKMQPESCNGCNGPQASANTNLFFFALAPNLPLMIVAL